MFGDDHGLAAGIVGPCCRFGGADFWNSSFARRICCVDNGKKRCLAFILLFIVNCDLSSLSEGAGDVLAGS